VLSGLRNRFLAVPVLTFVLAIGLSTLVGSPYHKVFARGAGGMTAPFNGFCICDLKNLITLGEVRKLNLDLNDPFNSTGKIDATVIVDLTAGQTDILGPVTMPVTTTVYPVCEVDCRMSDGSIQTGRFLMHTVGHADQFHHPVGVQTYEKDRFKSKLDGYSLASSLQNFIRNNNLPAPGTPPATTGLVSELIKIKPEVYALLFDACDTDKITDTLYITPDTKGNGGGSSAVAD
jgi:hypothetical protein